MAAVMQQASVSVRAANPSEGQTIERDGTIRGDRVRSTRIGFGLNSLYSPWLSFSTLAAEWVMAEGDLGATMDFRNELFQLDRREKQWLRMLERAAE